MLSQQTEQLAGCCLNCGSPKIHFSDVNEITCRICGETVNFSKYFDKKLIDARERFHNTVACPRCKSLPRKLVAIDTIKCKICGERFMFPEHLRKSYPPEVMELLWGKRTQPKNRQQVAKTIEERPDGPDFGWFVADLVKSARRHGYQGLSTFEEEKQMQNFNERRPWIKRSIGKNHFNINQLQKDWQEVSRGDKTVQEVSSSTFCYNELLLDPPALTNKTGENAQALSAALKEELPKERGKYLGQQQDRYAEIESVVNTQGVVPYKTAAAFLAPHLRLGTCSNRYIGKLSVPEGPLVRINGRIETASLQKYKRTLLQKQS